MTLPKEKVVALIQEGGLLSRLFSGFEPRIQQQKMLENVVEAYNQSKVALIEAGTGTGKSVAYLIPALLWAVQCKERTVISTNTITLQEQLLHKDIPNLIKALDLKLKVVLVKGMNNYICLRKLEDALSEISLFKNEGFEEIEKINQFKSFCQEGSRSELPFMPSVATWERVGAESEACSRNDCPFFQECYFFKARRMAQEAQILVANHHLLFSDLTRRAEINNYSDPAILPPYRRVILDEAHHIEDIATEYFASRLSRLDLLKILGKLTADKHAANQGKLPLLREKMGALFPKGAPHEVLNIIQRLTIDLPGMRHVIQEKIHQLFDHLASFIESIKKPFGEQEQKEKKLRLLDDYLAHVFWIQTVVPHGKQLLESLRQYTQGINSIDVDLKEIDHPRLQEQTKSIRIDIQGLILRLENSIAVLHKFLSEETNKERVRWIETRELKALLNVELVDANLDVSRLLVDYLFSQFPTIVLCSATLATNQHFDFVKKRYGLQPHLLKDRAITENIYDSPFDFKNQSLLAVPTDLPPPTHPDFNAIAFENVWKAIQVSHGQAFVLFTSYQMMQACYDKLAPRLERELYPVFKQGDENQKFLLQKFRQTKRAVLFGTDSFWEGVDVVGDALRCVIIVKLPFKVPSEPIIQARAEAILSKGGDPFFEFSMPHAIVKFKQGFGRLIRHKADRGCIICLDTRLVNKGYGKQFINSLPPCTTAYMNSERLWPRIEDFFRQTYHYVKKQQPTL